MLAPPRPPSHEQLEALMREARARQRRRRILAAAVIAIAAAAGLSVRAALPGGHTVHQVGRGGSPGATGSRSETGRGRVPIVQVGSGGGVTWAINGVGMWLTINGGRSWRASAPRQVRASGDLLEHVQQVEFLDRRYGWVVSDGGLDWTRDGGRTWRRTTAARCCDNVSFVTPSLGYASGSSFLATTDGGATWAPVSRPPSRFGALAFADRRHGVAVLGKPPGLFRTTDGGRRWTNVHAVGWPLAVGSFGSRLVVPAERADGRRLVVYVSADGGSSWTARKAPPWWVPVIGSRDAQTFSAVSPTVWFAAGWRKLVVTRDAGRTWRLVPITGLPARWTIPAISFTSSRVGWAVFQSYGAPAAPPRPQSVLMRTTDGGVHWKPAGPRRPERHKHA